jgi:hypothetical protein
MDSISQELTQIERKNSMNRTLSNADLVAQWRSGEKQDSPAGPLFAAGEFAEADIVNATARDTNVSICSGSFTVSCC